MSCASTDCQGSLFNVLLDSGSTKDPSIAIAPDGVALVAYVETTTNTLKTARCAGAGCATPTVAIVDAGQTVAGNSSVAYDGTSPVMSYTSGIGELKLARCALVDCTGGSGKLVTLVAPMNFNSAISLAISPAGTPTVSYQADDARLQVAKCLDIACKTVATSVIDGGLGTGEFSDIAYGMDGLPVVAYSNYFPPVSLKVAKCNTGLCQ